MRIASQFALELENHASDWRNFPLPPHGERIGADLSMGFPAAFLERRGFLPTDPGLASMAPSRPDYTVSGLGRGIDISWGAFYDGGHVLEPPSGRPSPSAVLADRMGSAGTQAVLDRKATLTRNIEHQTRT